ncbi:hypothetical protein AVEN_82889-1 [Araneus ventricosus]|uniref:BESS domain-containing protein n=1 Tax=Araneus ventricosus TaxID=182803 RepID=A0A4Y2JYZ2_ARAVE|nr:hypothetical protein AVEN_82889-1 [Araneus ventricosus]
MFSHRQTLFHLGDISRLLGDSISVAAITRKNWTETQSSLEEAVIEEDTERQNGLQQEKQELSEKSSPYEENSERKRKPDLEASLIQFMKSPVPQPAAAPEPDADRSFVDSILPSIKDFTEDQKLEFRSVVLSIVNRMRKSCISNNVNLPNTSRHVSVSNLTCAIPDLTQHLFHTTF